MLAAVAWLIWSGNRPTSAQGVAPTVRRHFLQTGKTYTFHTGPVGSVEGKIVEAPEDNWVKLEAVTDQKKGAFWVNLNLIFMIEQTTGAN
jgi:hypothetical protein